MWDGNIIQSECFSGSQSVMCIDGVPSPTCDHAEHKSTDHKAGFGVPSPPSGFIDATDIGRRLNTSAIMSF